MLFELAAERAVQSGENERGIMGVGPLAGECDFEHGGDQRSWHAVSRDVGDQNANTLFIDAKEIVEIPGDGAHGHVARSNLKSCEGGDALWKGRGLNPARDFQLLIDGDESRFVREGPVRGDVSKTRNKNQEANKLQVGPSEDLKTQEIRVHDEQTPNKKTHDKDANFVR